MDPTGTLRLVQLSSMNNLFFLPVFPSSVYDKVSLFGDLHLFNKTRVALIVSDYIPVCDIVTNFSSIRYLTRSCNLARSVAFSFLLSFSISRRCSSAILSISFSSSRCRAYSSTRRFVSCCAR